MFVDMVPTAATTKQTLAADDDEEEDMVDVALCVLLS
jgi:hypothetical protein